MTRIHLRPDVARKDWPHEPGPHEPGPQPPPGGRPALLTLVGLSLAACITVVALLVLLLSYGDGPTLIVARWAPQPVSTPSLSPENLPSARATRSIYLPGGRGGVSASASNAIASNNLGSGRTARRRAGSTRSTSRSNAVAANDRARSRESGANHRTAQGEPAASRQREFKSHWGAQGDPGRDETRAREGFRAEPAQDGTASVTASDAAGPGLAQARADG